MKITTVSIAQEASLWSLPAEDPVLSWASPCEICGGQSGTWTDFSPSTSVFLCQNHYTNALLIFIYIMLLPEGRAGEAWEPSKTQCCFGNMGPLDTKELSLGLYRPRRLFEGLLQRWTVFYQGPVRVGFVVHKVALGRVLLRVLRYSSVSVIPSILCTESCITDAV
jgi:hypothetical protein